MKSTHDKPVTTMPAPTPPTVVTAQTFWGEKWKQIVAAHKAKRLAEQSAS